VKLKLFSLKKEGGCLTIIVMEYIFLMGTKPVLGFTWTAITDFDQHYIHTSKDNSF